MKKQIGFTIIELIIVIAVIAILAAVAISYFFNLEAEARVATFRGELNQLKTFQQYYHSRNQIYANKVETMADPEFEPPEFEWDAIGDENGYCVVIGEDLAIPAQSKHCYFATKGEAADLPTDCNPMMYLTLDQNECNF